jgi:hypothetical protein
MFIVRGKNATQPVVFPTCSSTKLIYAVNMAIENPFPKKYEIFSW